MTRLGPWKSPIWAWASPLPRDLRTERRACSTCLRWPRRRWVPRGGSAQARAGGRLDVRPQSPGGQGTAALGPGAAGACATSRGRLLRGGPGQRGSGRGGVLCALPAGRGETRDSLPPAPGRLGPLGSGRPGPRSSALRRWGPEVTPPHGSTQHRTDQSLRGGESQTQGPEQSTEGPGRRPAPAPRPGEARMSRASGPRTAGARRAGHMAFCTRRSRQVLPEAASSRNTQTSPPRLSRVNGWSRPLHSFQIVAWTVFLILAFTTFVVFIPLLPRDSRYIAHSVVGPGRPTQAVNGLPSPGGPTEPSTAGATGAWTRRQCWEPGRLALPSAHTWRGPAPTHGAAPQTLPHAPPGRAPRALPGPSCSLTSLQVTGGIFFLHFLVHLAAISIDPAEASVRSKNYSQPMPTFDRSKHLHVIQNQYCHLCEVTVCVDTPELAVPPLGRPSWALTSSACRYFFGSVASASAGLLCIIAVLLYIFFQYLFNSAALRTDSRYQSVSSKNTWLLFLPISPVRTSSCVLLALGLLVLLLALISLLLLGHLLFFHLYLMAKSLSTFDYMTQGRQQQDSKHQTGKRNLSLQTEDLSQPLDSPPGPSEQGETPKELLPSSRHPSLCSTATVQPEDTLTSLKKSVANPSSSVQSVKSTHLSPAAPDYLQASNLSIHANSCSSQQEASASRSPSAVRVKRKEFLASLSRCSSLSSVSTITPESSPPPQNTKGQRESKQLRAGDAAENQGSASEAQGPEPAESRFQGSFSTGIPAVESVPEPLQLPSLLQGRDQNVWAQEHQDTVPSCQEPWAVESTVINYPGGLGGELDGQQVPRTQAVMPFVQAPESLPAIKEECGEEGTLVISEVGGCTPMKAPVPSSPTPVTMIMMLEDPELGDRAPQLA
ncbi:uncharacterized protein LOC120879239 [Oryx dammah]|uniref:uncharacterized protein LOC120879239 n=1 Tax=Oryx dammah TaxID=59534 RepID=UPI001A9B44FE|nr:uncharacterized protein LOC120879239 [Oryx dammah]